MTPNITLKYPGAEDVKLEFGHAPDEKKKWLQQMILLPWATPQRLVGFVHPSAEKDVGESEFLLHATFAYYGSVGMKPIGPDKLQAVEGPKILLPYDLISPVDVRIYSCPSAIWLRDQDERFQELFTGLAMQQINPPQVIVPPAILP